MPPPPVVPVVPVVPVAPVEPVDPVAAVEPVVPVAPVAPVEPVDPVAEVELVGPVEPVVPVAPVEPVEPVSPVGPVEPVIPVVPVAPVAPVVPVVVPVVPVVPVAAVELVLPVALVAPVVPVAPVAPVVPVEAVEPVAPVVPVALVVPVVPVAPVDEGGFGCRSGRRPRRPAATKSSWCAGRRRWLVCRRVRDAGAEPRVGGNGDLVVGASVATVIRRVSVWWSYRRGVPATDCRCTDRSRLSAGDVGRAARLNGRGARADRGGGLSAEPDVEVGERISTTAHVTVANPADAATRSNARTRGRPRRGPASTSSCRGCLSASSPSARFAVCVGAAAAGRGRRSLFVASPKNRLARAHIAPTARTAPSVSSVCRRRARRRVLTSGRSRGESR